MGVGCGGEGCGGCLGLPALGFLLRGMKWGCIGTISSATGAAIGSTPQAAANPAGQAAAEGSGTPTVTVEELRAKQKEYRKRLNSEWRPMHGPRGMMARAAQLYQHCLLSGSSAVAELALPDTLKEGEQLCQTLEWKKACIDAWTVDTVIAKAAECDDLLDKLKSVFSRMSADVKMCRPPPMKRPTSEAAKKRRKLVAETKKNVAWLGCSAGDLTDTLAGILKPGLDDPSAFVEKGVVKDPVEFTQAEVNKCVLFGWNGVLNNADTCHHLLMMFLPRCSAPPNPDPGSPLRGSPIREIAIAFPRSLGTFGECGVGASSPITLCHRKDPVARPLTTLVDFAPVCHV